MIAKKKAILQKQQVLFEGFEKLGFAPKKEPGLHSEAFKTIDAQYQKAKSGDGYKTNPSFESEIRPVFQTFKITISQYNKLITKKPYSFVAKLMGHRHLG